MGREAIRLLTIAVVVMGVLILGGTGLLLWLLVGRGTATAGHAAPPVATVLDEPVGTRILGASGTADALVLRLSGGGPDRVVVLDGRSGRVVARAGLAR